MGKIPNELREIVTQNIRDCRLKKFPGRGGAKKCAETFGVSPQQWSPWERGMRTPDEMRLEQIAEFFGVSVEYLQRDNQAQQKRQKAGKPSGFISGAPGGGIFSFTHPHGAAVAVGTGDAGESVVYVPVFVILPCLPGDMKGLYDQFTAALNGGRGSGKAAE